MASLYSVNIIGISSRNAIMSFMRSCRSLRSAASARTLWRSSRRAPICSPRESHRRTPQSSASAGWQVVLCEPTLFRAGMTVTFCASACIYFTSLSIRLYAYSACLTGSLYFWENLRIVKEVGMIHQLSLSTATLHIFQVST